MQTHFLTALSAPQPPASSPQTVAISHALPAFSAGHKRRQATSSNSKTKHSPASPSKANPFADTVVFKMSDTKPLGKASPNRPSPSNRLAPFRPLPSPDRPPKLNNVCYTANNDTESCFSASLEWPEGSRAGKVASDRFETVYLAPERVISLAQIQGQRDHNEDRSLLKKLPARSGKEWQSRLQKAFKTLGKEMNRRFADGTTLVATVLSPDGKITTGWIGDSEAHLGIVDQHDSSCAIARITVPHNVHTNSEDVARIKQEGGIFSTRTGALKWTDLLPGEGTYDPETGLWFRAKRDTASNRLSLTRGLGDKYFSKLIREAEFCKMDFRRMPLAKHQRGYIVLNTDGCKNPYPDDNNGYWNNLMRHANEQNKAVKSGKQLSKAANLASWFVATSENISPGDNSSAMVIPISDPKRPLPYSLLAALGDGHGGHSAVEYAIKRLPELLK